MSLSTTLLLGFIAGGTIVFGLPVGRMRHPAPGIRIVLNAIAIGVLLFLLWDVLAAAWEPIDAALGDVHDHGDGYGRLFGYGALFAGGLSVGLLGLLGYERWMARTTRRTAGDAIDGPAASSGRGLAAWPPARRLALLIAVGIGLHNFAEGLAIGQAAASNAISLATVLVIGFALHNATEGFGIVAPLAAESIDGVDNRPGWGFLLAMAAIAGGPTFVGTAIGHSFTSEPVSVLFLTLAAGSIIYVVVQLLGVAGRAKRSDLLTYGLLIGLLAGFVTDAIVTAGGA
ncbi:MAG: ZIP family metal transporter [Mycobacteriales bacterium]